MTTDLIIELYHMVPLDEKKHHVVSLATSYYSDLITVTVAGALAYARTHRTAQATARVCVRGRVSCLHECVVHSVRHSLCACISSHIIYSQRAEGRREALRGPLSPSLHGRTRTKCDGVTY